jgi:hypothetical protein
MILRLHEADSSPLTAYVLRDWERIAKVHSRDDRDDIDVFIQDLRYRVRKRAPDASFFDVLGGLDIGPLRAFVSGSCPVQDLDAVIPKFFAEMQGMSSWRDHFENLRSDV